MVQTLLVGGYDGLVIPSNGVVATLARVWRNTYMWYYGKSVMVGTKSAIEQNLLAQTANKKVQRIQWVVKKLSGLVKVAWHVQYHGLPTQTGRRDLCQNVRSTDKEGVSLPRELNAKHADNISSNYIKAELRCEPLSTRYARFVFKHL